MYSWSIRKRIFVIGLFLLNPYLLGYSRTVHTEFTPLPQKISELTYLQALSEDPAIIINGNADFASKAKLNGWTGDGTESKPYRIGNISIDRTPDGGSGLSISNTNVHFIIQNITIKGSVNWLDRAFRLNNVTNGHLINNTVKHSYHGFYLVMSKNLIVSENIVGVTLGSGFYLDNSHNITLSENLVLHSGDCGFKLSNSDNNLVINNTAKNSKAGFGLTDSDHNNFMQNIANNNGFGFELSSSTNNSLTKNQASSNNAVGFYLFKSKNNFLDENIASNNGWLSGIRLMESSNNTLIYNHLVNNGLLVASTKLSDYFQANVSNNLLNGKPIIFWQNKTEGTIPVGTGQVILVNSHSVITKNQQLSNASVGFLAVFCNNLVIKDNAASGFILYHSHDNSLINNEAIQTSYGFWLDHSSNNTLTSNLASESIRAGFTVVNGNNNTLTNNQARNNDDNGFFSYSVNNSLFMKNIASNNGKDGYHLSIDMWKPDDVTKNNSFIGNFATQNDDNGFNCFGLENNQFSYNNASENGKYGINLDTTSINNQIYSNIFIDNNAGDIQARDDSGENVWTNGTHGNYWNDYTGSDFDMDGIGDTPYVLGGDQGAQDPHPLMKAPCEEPTEPEINVTITIEIVITQGDSTINGNQLTLDPNSIIDIEWKIETPDADKIDHASLFIDNKTESDSIAGDVTIISRSFSFDHGNHTIRIILYDLEGNEITSETIFITILEDGGVPGFELILLLLGFLGLVVVTRRKRK
ncbi:MAG: right-handed parallel beta-helix repeat-containing protein [Candidatus Hodarchaeales archaeon]|jgi:parallel beta-helix repeat protein